MTLIISIAYGAVLISSLFVIVRWRNVVCTGPLPAGVFTMVAILFTAGLDMGLIMLPMVEFPVYAGDPVYNFSNPLAVEFGMWGPLVWMMYFVSAFYFLVLEPKLKVFQIPAVKWIYNLTIIATCAFSCFLFMTNLPAYAPDLPNWAIWGLGMFVIAASVFTSSNLHFLKVLALSSTWGFIALTCVAFVVAAFVKTDLGIMALINNYLQLSNYFAHLDKFTHPISEYHEFYLFWWFSWSIMIGQFVARFVDGLKTWKLAFCMIVLPSIPLSLWFCVIYIYHDNSITIPVWLNWTMIALGVVFVVNSLDSLIRLYSSNIGLTPERLGNNRYYALHFLLQIGLVSAYFFTPFKIEWVGLVVIGIYAAVYTVIFMRLSHVGEAIVELKA